MKADQVLNETSRPEFKCLAALAIPAHLFVGGSSLDKLSVKLSRQILSDVLLRKKFSKFTKIEILSKGYFIFLAGCFSIKFL